MSKVKSGTSSSAGRGRPQMYPLTGVEVRKIRNRLGKGLSVSTIAEAIGVHPFAVLRVKRGSVN